MQDNMMRKESILILPHNTLRLTDLMLQFEIFNAKGTALKESFNDILWRLVNRKYKDLSLYNKGVDKDILDELYKVNFAKYYELAPRTLMNEIINITINQKFIKKAIILFSDKNAKDESFDYDYYDGTLESLEKYIIDNEITSLVFDDIELLKKLDDRKNISLKRMTFFISRLGYNFYRDDKTGNLKLKYFDEIYKNNPSIELTDIELFNFPKNTINKFKKRI